MVRGKKKIGYEMDLQVQLQLRLEDTTYIKASLKMNEVCDDEDECASHTLYLENATQDQKDVASKILKSEIKEVIKCIKGAFERYRSSIQA